MNFKKLFSIAVLVASFLPTIFGQDCLLSISTQGDAITVLNLQQDTNVKLFDENIQLVWGCDPWNGSPCTTEEQITGLTENAVYFLSVQSDNCDEWIPIIVNTEGPVATCSDGIQNQGEEGIDCGGPCSSCPGSECQVEVSALDGVIQINGLVAAANTKLFDEDLNTIWACNLWSGSACSSEEVITGLTVGGTYFVSVLSDNCSEWITIVASENTTCPDTDADGLCDDEDCSPFNPTLPGVPGAPCDDLNELTENDAILPDGCSCAGIIVELNDCEVDVTSVNGGIFVNGLPSDGNTKLFDVDFNVIWSCNPWNGNPCTSSETITGLTAGVTYYLSVQSPTCELWFPISVEEIDNNNECTVALGEFVVVDCVEFLEDGSIRFNAETTDGAYNNYWYDASGTFISSTSTNKANSISLENNRIIERNQAGVVIRDAEIDQDILSLYENGGTLSQVARYGVNEYILVGGFPEGGAGNEPYTDLLYAHHVDATGNLISQASFGQINYTAQDYEIYGSNFYSIEGVIPVAQEVGNLTSLEVYIEQFESGGIPSDFKASITRFDVDENFDLVNQTILKSNPGEAYLDIIIDEDLCAIGTYNIFCFYDDFTNGIQENILERVDHSNAAPYLSSRLTTSSNGVSTTYLLEVGGITTGNLRLQRTVPIGESLFPGEFVYGEVDQAGVFMADGTIVLETPPVSMFKKQNETYSFVTEMNGDVAFYTTDCEEMPDNNSQNFEAEKAAEMYVITDLFPNPADDEIFIKIESYNNTSAQLFVHDMTGRKIISRSIDLEIGNNSFDLIIAHLKKGIYNISVYSGNNSLQSDRFLKE